MKITEIMQDTKDSNVMKSWLPILDEAFEYIGKHDATLYEDIKEDIHASVYGECLSEEKAEKLVKAMKPYGEHWNYEQVESVLVVPNVAESSVYYVMNMMYNDYHKVLGDDVNMYVEMSRAWLTDVDNPKADEKTYRYAMDV